MKKLIPDQGGHPIFYSADMLHLTEAITEVQEGILKMLGGTSFLLSDTIIAFAGNIYTCPAGYMNYKGEVCAFDAQAVDVSAMGVHDLVWEPVVTYRSSNPLTNADLNQTSPHIIKKVKLAAYPTGTAPAESLLATSVATRAQALNSVIKGSWIEIPAFLNGWVAAAGFYSPSYRVDKDGKVTLRGDLQKGTSLTAFNLPAEGRPANTTNIITAAFGAGSAPEVITITPAGDVSFTDANGYDKYSLNGVSFYK